MSTRNPSEPNQETARVETLSPASEPVEPAPEETTPAEATPPNAVTDATSESNANGAPNSPAPAAPAERSVPGAPVAGPADPSAEPGAEEEIPMDEGSFAEMLSEFERQHEADSRGGETNEGTVISVSAKGVFVDLGIKREGMLPIEEFLDESGEPTVKAGDKVAVTIKGRTPDGYYRLSTALVAQPKDWSGLEAAYAGKLTIEGTVTGVIKGGLSVDVGSRAFMPASRSGTRDAAEMEALVGEEIRCKIIQLDTAKEDVVVDRRAVLEEEARAVRQARFAAIKEGDVVNGTVRTLTDFGAFIDLGGVDGLLHVTDMAWHRVKKPADLLSEGEKIDVKVLKVSAKARKISLGRKQLVPDPWSVVDEKYKQGERIVGQVVRLTDFGAFVELEQGVDGMIHISEMSWTKKIRKPSDVLKQGESVETVILKVDGAKRRIALGLKQALGDPWEEVEKKFPVGSTVEGKVMNLATFGAFVELVEGIEGMVHIADITNEKRLEHPKEALKTGDVVKAKVLEIDRNRKRVRLGMKQLEPTSADEYIAEHKVDDVVTGRVIDSRKGTRVELGEGVIATCRPAKKKKEAAEKKADTGNVDLSAMTAMLSAKWKAGALPAGSQSGGSLSSGQVRSFRIVSMNAEHKRIEVEPSE